MRFDTELVVNLGHLRSNIELLRKKYLQDQQIIFMIKANAYGHGIEEIASYTNKFCNIEHFGVASLAEAIYLRERLPSHHFNLLVFSELNLNNSEQAKNYENLNIVPVISSMPDLENLLENYPNLPLVLKFNTGMNRLGLEEDLLPEIKELLLKYKRKDIHHLMTHFSSSYFKIKQGDRTHQQYEAFQRIKSFFRHEGFSIKETSVANSGAIEQKFGLNETHVRPGLMLYGPRSVKEACWEGKIISSLKSKVIQLREIQKGTPVGYGGHISHATGIVAYLPVGYGDGFLTHYSGLDLPVGKNRGRILGRVNMDLTQLFFEDPPVNLTQGSQVSLWDETQSSIERICKHAKTIPYQIFTSITGRVSRRYYT